MSINHSKHTSADKIPVGTISKVIKGKEHNREYSLQLGISVNKGSHALSNLFKVLGKKTPNQHFNKEEINTLFPQIMIQFVGAERLKNS